MSTRVEEEQARTRHQRRPDERFGTRGPVVTVHDDQPGPNAAERVARDLGWLGEVRLMTRELDGGTKQGGSERISGKDQYILTAQRVSLHEAAGGCRDRGRE